MLRRDAMEVARQTLAAWTRPGPGFEAAVLREPGRPDAFRVEVYHRTEDRLDLKHAVIDGLEDMNVPSLQEAVEAEVFAMVEELLDA